MDYALRAHPPYVSGKRAALLDTPIRRRGAPCHTARVHFGSASLVLIVEIIAGLLAALMAPAWMLAHALDGLSPREQRALARFLKRYKLRGWFLLYQGEDDDAALRRLDRAKWIAKDPVAAMKHMLRKVRCPLARARFAMFAPMRFDPPLLACAPETPGFGEPCLDDTS